jgi:hypothetical protein
MTMKQVETLIVGGGISGLACARQLYERGREFVLVTDRLGGRMLANDDGLNLGAAYVTSDYRHVLRFVDRGQRIFIKDVYFWDEDRFISLFHPRNALRVGAVVRLYRLVWAFRARLKRLRERSAAVCQKELMEHDPLLRRYVAQPAADLVREHGLERVNSIFCAPIFRSTLFVPYHEANAFYFLANLFPIWLPTYALDVRRCVARLTAGFKDRILLAKVTAIEEVSGGEAFLVHAAAGEYRARNLVIATPCRNSAGLLDTGCAVRNIPACTLIVRGRRRTDYLPGRTVFLGDDHPIRVLWPQHNGDDIVYAEAMDPDLAPYYDGYTITGAVAWKTAMQLSDNRWRPLQPRPNLFTIGDHNIGGLEDSFLTGLFAANRIASALAGR